MTYSPYQTTILTKPADYQSIEGWFDFADIYDAILDRLRNGPAVMVEVGSWYGKSTAYFASRFVKLGLTNIQFNVVDTWRGSLNEAYHVKEMAKRGGDIYEIWQENMKRCKVLDWIKPYRMFSHEAAAQFADGSVDALFLDGDHSTEGLRLDIQSWRSKLKPGAFLGGHDIDFPEVRAAVDIELPGQWRRQGRSWVVDNWQG